MNICGIICEYNPFHNGHIHHINEIKKQFQPDLIICVMSSNFVQRGEPAIVDKWERTKIALQHGVDLVIELPFIYSVQSANYFAQASVHLLHLANVNTIVFGSESNSIKQLQHLATKDTSHFKNHLKQGLSSAQAYSKIYGDLPPNDILGINYIKYATPLQIDTKTILRTNAYHDTTLQSGHSSASAIRHAIANQLEYTKHTPMLALQSTHLMKHYYPSIQFLLYTLPPAYLSQLFLMDEGIEHRLIKFAKQTDDYDHFLNLCISKRYTKARIQRTLIHLLNQTTKQSVNDLSLPNYLRILGFNQKGQKHIKSLVKQEVCIASKFNQIPQPYKEMEWKATSVYYQVVEDRIQHIHSELQKPIFIEREIPS